MLKYKDKEIIIIESHSNKSIIMEVESLKSEFVNNDEIEIIKEEIKND